MIDTVGGSGVTPAAAASAPSTARRRAVRRAACTAALASAIAGVAAPAAVADSIVYIDGGNVWAAEPDGSRKVQLTDGGDWHSPTQADDGTIAAVQGAGPIQVMARDGRPQSTIATPPAPSGDGGTFAPRPVQLSFSPDGTKIAYSYVAYSCPVASTCGTIQRSTFYTEAHVTEATPHSRWGNQFGVSNPEWVTGTRALVFGGSGSQVSIDDLVLDGRDDGRDYSHTAWITPAADMGDGEVSRDGTRLAATMFYGPDTVIVFLAVKGDVRSESPPPQPDVACNTHPPDERYADPSWSPDGSAVAYASSAGIEIARFTRLDAGGCETVPNTVLSPTGSEPDWGPSDPPAARWMAPDGDPGGDGAGPGPGDTPGARPRLRVLTTRVSSADLRRGLVVKVLAPASGKLVVRLGSVAKGRATAKRAGKVAVQLTKVSRRKAAALRGRRVALRISFRPGDGAARTVARTVRVR